MKIIIAPDSFKGSLTALQAATAMKQGVRDAIPEAEVEVIPMADGGEGTLDAIVSSTHGEMKEVEVSDPLGRKITGKYGVLGNGETAVIEMASVSGLLLLKEDERNPLHTTTYGTGQLLLHVLEAGYRDFIFCIGGSSTNDCGTGMAQALGVRFFGKEQKTITEKMCGGLLGEVISMKMDGLHPAIRHSRTIVACDVTNPLLGENGCSMVYAPQKGATPEMALQLENNMISFITIAETLTGRNVRDIPGTGAAGGLGAGLMLFLNAELQSGIEIVLHASHFSDRIKHADLILTGEGKIDKQTAFGKTITGISRCAKQAKIPVIAFGGIVDDSADLREIGVIDMFSIRDEATSHEEAMAQASALLQITVAKVMRSYKKPF